jgi:hypothetical protein
MAKMHPRKMASNSGIGDTTYLVDKGVPKGMDAKFNQLPPGIDISAQENADIREMRMQEYSGGGSYSGDGG